MKNNNVSLHRVFATSAEKVYRAFTNADALASWLPPYGYTAKVDHINVTVGGTYKMSFTNFTTEKTESFGGEYLEIKPNEFLKYKDKFDDPNLPGEMIVTVWFKEVSCGVDIKITQDNIPEQIPSEMCYLGWQDSLDKLKKLVEPNIPNT